MTFKQQLDAKVKDEAVKALWEEIKDLFLQAVEGKSNANVTITIFYNSSPNEIFYSIGDKRTGNKFKQIYDKSALVGVIPICEKEGLIVKKDHETSYRLIYN